MFPFIKKNIFILLFSAWNQLYSQNAPYWRWSELLGAPCMRLPRAEVAPWAHGHYERKAPRPSREGAAAGPANPSNVSQRVPGLQGLHARGAPWSFHTNLSGKELTLYW